MNEEFSLATLQLQATCAFAITGAGIEANPLLHQRRNRAAGQRLLESTRVCQPSVKATPPAMRDNGQRALVQ